MRNIGRVFILALTLALTAPVQLALAHHKDGHDGGPNVENPSIPQGNEPDKVEGVQGNSPSAPDQDGHGPDRDNPVQESDVDGNNGNGNDNDRCDDDEGNNPQCVPTPVPTFPPTEVPDDGCTSIPQLGGCPTPVVPTPESTVAPVVVELTPPALVEAVLPAVASKRAENPVALPKELASTGFGDLIPIIVVGLGLLLIGFLVKNIKRVWSAIFLVLVLVLSIPFTALAQSGILPPINDIVFVDCDSVDFKMRTSIQPDTLTVEIVSPDNGYEVHEIALFQGGADVSFPLVGKDGDEIQVAVTAQWRGKENRQTGLWVLDDCPSPSPSPSPSPTVAPIELPSPSPTPPLESPVLSPAPTLSPPTTSTPVSLGTSAVNEEATEGSELPAELAFTGPGQIVLLLLAIGALFGLGIFSRWFAARQASAK